MAVGFTNPDAVHVQIEQTIQDGVKHARRALRGDSSSTLCVVCGEGIPEARRLALKGVQTCIICQGDLDSKYALHRVHNRKAWHRCMR